MKLEVGAEDELGERSTQGRTRRCLRRSTMGVDGWTTTPGGGASRYGVEVAGGGAQGRTLSDEKRRGGAAGDIRRCVVTDLTEMAAYQVIHQYFYLHLPQQGHDHLTKTPGGHTHSQG